MGRARAGLTYPGVRRSNRTGSEVTRGRGRRSTSASLAGLEGPHDRVSGLLVVLRRVPPRRGVAAADMTAAEAEPQLHRVRALGQTLQTGLAQRLGLRVRQRVGVRALFHDCQVTTGVRMAARKTRAGEDMDVMPLLLLVAGSAAVAARGPAGPGAGAAAAGGGRAGGVLRPGRARLHPRPARRPAAAAAPAAVHGGHRQLLPRSAGPAAAGGAAVGRLRPLRDLRRRLGRLSDRAGPAADGRAGAGRGGGAAGRGRRHRGRAPGRAAVPDHHDPPGRVPGERRHRDHRLQGGPRGGRRRGRHLGRRDPGVPARRGRRRRRRAWC